MGLKQTEDFLSSSHMNRLKWFYEPFLWRYSRAGNLLISSSLIRSFAQIAQIKWATVSDLLRSLRTNERLWANRSGHSWQMSKCERFAQVAQDKWVAEKLRKPLNVSSIRRLKGDLLIIYFQLSGSYKTDFKMADILYDDIMPLIWVFPKHIHLHPRKQTRHVIRHTWFW